jgi:hypothetical protein
MKALCENLLLSITHTDANEIRLVLRNDISLDEVSICYPVAQPVLAGGSRRYQLREAMVIGVRRLVSEAVKAGLISDVPGTATSLKSDADPGDVILFPTDDEG